MKIVIGIVIVLIVGVAFLIPKLFTREEPKDNFDKPHSEYPYVLKGVLYTKTTQISMSIIEYVELVQSKYERYIIIHYQYSDSKFHSGMLTMTEENYLKVRQEFLSRNIAEVKTA